MEKILIFAGTKEGRILAQRLCSSQREAHVCVATEYGQEVLPKREGLIVHQGRMGQLQMERLLTETEWSGVVDATHPYAVEVSANVKAACEKTGRAYMRLLREQDREEEGRVHYVDTKEEAAAYLNSRTGNILLTTGSKEIKEYISLISDISRIYVRILADSEAVRQCKELGLAGKQIICMQGPFSAELNAAMLKQLEASYLLTKDTGKTGGFPQKLQGAEMAGAKAVVLRRPKEAEGYSLKELLAHFGSPVPEEEKQNRRVTLLGIGMGNPSGMTIEAKEAIEQADLILGAGRMLQALSGYGKRMEEMYEPKAVLNFLRQHPQYRHAVVAFSGDIGFYSGTSKLLGLLEKDFQVETVCGISSVVYAASKLGMPWQDMKLLSIHGRRQNVSGAVRTHKRCFVLAGGAKSVKELANELVAYGCSDLTMHVGYQLSYPQEAFFSGKPEEFLTYEKEGLSVVILENPAAEEAVVTHGISDSCFLRGNAPMTKEEIRSISLSKLALTKTAQVYDIGAGTGSVGVECARQACDGTVYAIEKKEGARKLLLENKHRMKAANLSIVAGTAPEALKELPSPTHAFIGGSSGNMESIVATLLEKNPKVRIVINAISMETAAEVMAVARKWDFLETEIVQVSVAKAKEVGGYHMMMGQNPVFIFTLAGGPRRTPDSRKTADSLEVAGFGGHAAFRKGKLP